MLLSLGIWRITPQYEAADQPQYAINIGINDPSYYRTFEAIANPNQIVLDFGEGKHTVLFPGQPGYLDGMDLLRKAAFQEVSLTNEYSEAEWRKIVSDTPSVQFKFDATMPAQALADSGLLKFNAQIDPTMVIRSLYLFRLPEENDYRVLVYGGADARMFISRVEIPKDRMSKLLEEEKNNPAYGMYGQSLNKNFYLPLNRIPLERYSLELSLDTHNQRLIDSFFLDKSLTSRVLEKDGSQIITDGSRSVRVGELDKMIEYRNLGVDRTSVRKTDGEYGVVRALNFVNEHGGFVGNVLLHEVNTYSTRASKNDTHDYQFRQYQNGLPIVGDLSSDELSLYRNEIAQMRRSQYTVVKANEDKTVEIISGPELLKLVEQSVWLDRNRITNVYLAYLAGAPVNGVANLRPVWVVEQAVDGRIGMFDAVTGDRLSSEEGMLLGLE